MSEHEHKHIEPKAESEWAIVGEPGQELIALPSGATVYLHLDGMLIGKALLPFLRKQIDSADDEVSDD